MRARWPLAVCGVTRPTCASSEAVSARPSISAWSIPARAGSPTSDATVANIALLAIAELQDRASAPYTAPRPDASVITVTWLGALEHNARMTTTQMLGSTFYGWWVVGGRLRCDQELYAACR